MRQNAALCGNGLYNSLSTDKILERTKSIAFADDKINVARLMTPVLRKVENIEGKGKNTGYQHFFLIPNNVFRSLIFYGH